MRRSSTQGNGFALPTLMVMLALASIATLLALRNLWVNAQLLNAETDQLRTQHKAEALLPIALADIRGTATHSTAPTTSDFRHAAGDATHTHVFYPNNLAEYDELRQRLGVNTCSMGICAPHALHAYATQASHWKALTANAMSVSASDTPYGDNTAWYWVEVFPHTNTDTFVYRITALANGIFPGSNTVVQAIWVRQSATSLTGQWQNWHVLHD